MTEDLETSSPVRVESIKLSRLERMTCLLLVVGHIVLATLWLWLSPKGFPWTHPRFTLNWLVPLVILAWGGRALLATHRENRAGITVLLSAVSVAYVAFAAAARWFFPVSFLFAWMIPTAAGGLTALLALMIGSRAGCASIRSRAMAIVGGGLLGGLIPLLLLPPVPATHPAGGTPELAENWIGTGATSPGILNCGPDVVAYASDGTIQARFSGIALHLSPLLSFLSQSPDGCWTILTLPSERSALVPRLREAVQLGSGGRLRYELPTLGRSSLTLDRDDSGGLEIDAAAWLDRPVYSHLNTFCDIEVRGHSRLSLGFSPCPETHVEVRRFDYPFGRPSRFAYVSADRRFRVVEAQTGEKGPFRTLAEGVLKPEDPLVITVFDQDQPRVAVTLHDWSAQASTQLSPTAGWGVPVNAIEFSLNDDGPTSAASIFISLAGTSVGRGWDSVGHAAGAYRNRLTVRPVGDSDSSR